MPIQNATLRQFANTFRSAAASTTPSSGALLEDIVGSLKPLSLELKSALRSETLAPSEKLAHIKNHLNAEQLKDLNELLSDEQVTRKLAPPTVNFLKALVNLEPLGATDAFLTTDAIARVAPEPATVAAVRKMRELVGNGRLSEYYAAAIGEDSPLKTEALKLFESLPKLNGASTADDFVAYGLWTQSPKGIEAMQKSARYLPGRQVLVETTVHSNVFEERTFLSYKEGGLKARTYRATLAGESGENFLVKVDGRDEPISVPKQQILNLNQPHLFEGDTIRLSKSVDYRSPLMKAKIAEAAIKMDALVGQIDFTQVSTKKGGAFSFLGTGTSGRKMSELQRECVRVVHDVIDMKYPNASVRNEPGRSSAQDAGRMAVKGIGACYEQASVMAGLLNPFRNSLGVDVQFISGGVYRNIKEPDVNPFRGGAHGWLQITYRPSMELRICDRTWTQPDHPADRAYSRWGDRYPGAFESRLKQQPISETDINLSGGVSVATFERQFGEQGRDGRENHMSLNQ